MFQLEDRTDHSAEIAVLRRTAETLDIKGLLDNPDAPASIESLTYYLAADLLGCHDDTGISLDNWLAARQLVERLTGTPVRENHV